MATAYIPGASYSTNADGTFTRAVQFDAAVSPWEASERDGRITLAPHDAEAARPGLLMTREINESTEEVESLRRSLAQAERGEVRWLADGESLSDAIGSD